MGLFDGLQNIVSDLTSHATDSAQNIIGDVTEIPLVQDASEHITNATDSLGTIADQGQTAIEDVTNKLGL